MPDVCQILLFSPFWVFFSFGVFFSLFSVNVRHEINFNFLTRFSYRNFTLQGRLPIDAAGRWAVVRWRRLRPGGLLSQHTNVNKLFVQAAKTREKKPTVTSSFQTAQRRNLSEKSSLIVLFYGVSFFPFHPLRENNCASGRTGGVQNASRSSYFVKHKQSK